MIVGKAVHIMIQRICLEALKGGTLAPPEMCIRDPELATSPEIEVGPFFPESLNA